MDDGDGGELELRNCTGCRSTLSMPAPMQWVVRSYTQVRPNGLRLSVSMGDRDGGFANLTWCWFVYDIRQQRWDLVDSGRGESLTDAKTKASECAEKWSRNQ